MDSDESSAKFEWNFTFIRTGIPIGKYRTLGRMQNMRQSPSFDVRFTFKDVLLKPALRKQPAQT